MLRNGSQNIKNKQAKDFWVFHLLIYDLNNELTCKHEELLTDLSTGAILKF
jgi:hypothetical protein